ncbi:MAG: TolC family protein [candidate division Zixibacteria bacterium]|nr:TolC family protein [candidate division Zixibacteria bacterium]MDH4032342.1 TolC family protein [candidate division Zixibacteria bacterium]
MKLLAKTVGIGCLLLMFVPSASAEVLTLDEAIDIAVNRTGRGGIIEGNFEVAEQQYFAEKIGFYLPEISINATAPSYGSNERWGYLYGTDTKSTMREPFRNLAADISLKQSLITGGELTARADLTDSDGEHPNRDGVQVDESSQLGRFSFSLTQPVLQPSQPKYDLSNRRDDLELAQLKRAEETANLKTEVVEAFIGVLQSKLSRDRSEAELERAQLQVGIDSAKLADGIVSDDQWLETLAGRLDAELKQFESEDVAAEQRRTLATLLDVESVASQTLMPPDSVRHIDQDTRQRFLTEWENSAPLQKAKYEYDKQKRTAGFTESAHGLSGTLTANYNMSRGEVEDAGITDDLKTNSWEVKLDLSYPLWDGGASGAAVKAARLSADQARLEYEKTEKSVQAQIATLLNQADVSFRKLDVLRQKIGIAETKLGIAKSRLDDGQISKLTYLESEISLLEAKNDHLEELKKYYSTRIQLEGNYLD